MSKIPCNVIRDLMILYEDNVCSEESRQMVDSHIEECESCRKEYQIMNRSLPEISFDKQGGESADKSGDEFLEYAKRAVKKFERRMTYKHLMTFYLVVVLAVVMLVIWKDNLQYRVKVVPSEDIRVSELYELENGDIYCTFTCKDIFGGVQISGLKVPQGKTRQNSDQGWYEISFQYPGLFEKSIAEKIYDNQISVVFKRKVQENENWIENEEGRMVPDESSIAITHICTSIYYKGNNKEDRLPVWEAGQKIEPAPEAIEERVRENEEYSEYYWEGLSWIIE